MATVVTLNTRVTSHIVGTFNDPNISFYDPVTGVNLTKNNPTSGDISSFSSLQLANVAHAVRCGILTLVSGSLPADSNTYATYSLYATAGSIAVPGRGITGVSSGSY